MNLKSIPSFLLIILILNVYVSEIDSRLTRSLRRHRYDNIKKREKICGGLEVEDHYMYLPDKHDKDPVALSTKKDDTTADVPMNLLSLGLDTSKGKYIIEFIFSPFSPNDLIYVTEAYHIFYLCFESKNNKQNSCVKVSDVVECFNGYKAKDHYNNNKDAFLGTQTAQSFETAFKLFKLDVANNAGNLLIKRNEVFGKDHHQNVQINFDLLLVNIGDSKSSFLDIFFQQKTNVDLLKQAQVFATKIMGQLPNAEKNVHYYEAHSILTLGSYNALCSLANFYHYADKAQGPAGQVKNTYELLIKASVDNLIKEYLVIDQTFKSLFEYLEKMKITDFIKEFQAVDDDASREQIMSLNKLLKDKNLLGFESLQIDALNGKKKRYLIILLNFSGILKAYILNLGTLKLGKKKIYNSCM